MIKRIFDIILAISLLIALVIPMGIIGLIIMITSSGGALHWSKRVGKDKVIFLMPKFRTLRSNTPQLATHLLEDPEKYYTPIGKFLRKSSLDELPQLWSILIGNMSFVGPRPALYNQDDLISLRQDSGINSLIPGLTGWAQINGRDEVSIEEKVKLDLIYLKKASISFDIIIMLKTLLKAIKLEEVNH